MELTPELFQVPYKGRTFIYAPLEGSVLEVTPGVIDFLNQVQSGKDPRGIDHSLTEQLIKAKILRETNFELGSTCSCSAPYCPTSVTLLPTYDCNLRCVYCYARAGEEISQVMTKEVVKSSLDLIVQNALNQKKKQVHLGFHGGGEPILSRNMDLLNYAIIYLRQLTKEHNLEYTAGAVSNGVWSGNTFDWVINNLNSVNISLDGPKDIQNSQRPLGKDGKSDSFYQVMGTIRRLEEAKTPEGEKFPYGIRATITATSVGRMAEIIEFFHSISTNKHFHLEPLFECGRCSTSNVRAPDSEEFLANLIKAQKRAKELGVAVYYSGGSLEKLSSTFCGACGSNFFVTPNGHVTSCLEACREEDTLSNIFYIGKLNQETKQFEFDRDKIKILSNRRVEKMSFCEDCFAKYNCSGDCPAKVYEQTGDLLDSSANWRCTINRGLLMERMAEALDKSKEQVVKWEVKSGQKNC